jgi:hypothetical protein
MPSAILGENSCLAMLARQNMERIYLRWRIRNKTGVKNYTRTTHKTYDISFYDAP